MAKALNATIYLGSNTSRQSAQIYAGLGLLAHAGIIKLHFNKSANVAGKVTVNCMVEHTKIAFDMHDREGFIESGSYNWCDVYFKRSCTARLLSQYNKIQPWGLNVGLTSRYDFAWQRATAGISFMQALKKYVTASTVTGWLFNMKNNAYNRNWKRLQQPPLKTHHPLISFSARLWETKENLGDEKNEDRLRINNERIAFVKALKKNFPGYYTGGIEDTALARQLCPELVMPAGKTNNKSFIRNLKESSIGIATPGLLNSVGWKFSEYLLLSKAIVSNSIEETILPNPCVNGINYMAYTTIDDMLANVERLVKDEELRFAMMDNNYHYSQNFMLPHKQLAQALNRVGFDIVV